MQAGTDGNDLWTNNNSESLNNILKLATGWKPQKLPVLVDKIADIIQLHMNDLRRALHGTGNYMLTAAYKRFLVPSAVWSSKTKEEKDKHFLKFLSAKTVTSNYIKATNVEFEIPAVSPRAARKPGQVRRPRAEKARPCKV